MSPAPGASAIRGTCRAYATVVDPRRRFWRVSVWLLVWLLPLGVANGGVYKWVDDQGRVHFGDKPPPEVKAEEVPIRTFSGPAEVSKVDGNVSARRVLMLSTVWCGYCRKAKEFLVSRGVAFTELDVEKDEEGKREYRNLQGRGVPIIVVGNQRMNGFDAKRLEAMLKAVGL